MVRFWITSLEECADADGCFEFRGLRFDERYEFSPSNSYSYEGQLTYLKNGSKIVDFGFVGRSHRVRGGFFLVVRPRHAELLPTPPFLLVGIDAVEFGFEGTVVLDASEQYAEKILSLETFETIPVGGAGWFGVATVLDGGKNPVKLGLQTYHYAGVNAGPTMSETISNLSIAEEIGHVIEVQENKI